MSPLSEADCAEIRSVLEGKATGFSYNDLARWLSKAGFAPPKRPSGSHRTWRHGSGRRIPLVDKGRGETLPVYVKRAASLILETGGCSEWQ